MGESLCPTSVAVAQLPSGIMQEIEKLVCEAAEKGGPVVAGAICSKLHDKIPEVPEATCEAVVNGALGKLESLCPTSLAVTQLPSGIMQEIEKLVCEAAEKGEPVVAGAICSKLHDNIPEVSEATCEALVNGALSKLESLCPTSMAVAQLPNGIMQELEKLVCEAAEKGEPIVAGA